ncbi:MAG: WD40 repeat domain-containing protein, partial [Bacteroidia bacterium]|nr:WD40 repeat domain-containing protein [Bacteroidia bacterium]
MQATIVHRLTGHAGPIYCLAYGLKAHTIFSGSADRFVAEWDLETGLPSSFSIKLQTIPYSILHLQERKLLLIGNGQGEVHWIDLVS